MATEQKDPSVEIDIEQGMDEAFPFTVSYDPVVEGVKRSSREELFETTLPEYQNDIPTVRQLEVMRRRDGQVRALYRLLTLPILSSVSTAEILVPEGGDKEAKFIEDALLLPPEGGGMTVTFHRFMSQLLSSLFLGFSAFEKVFWVPSDGPLKGKTTLKKLAFRPATSVTFVVDKSGGYQGFRQKISVNGQSIDVYIPKEYSFYYAAQEEECKFYGISFFQSAFYHYDKKTKLYYIAHLAAQRSAVGTRVGTIPVGGGSKQQRQNFSNALKNLSLAQWMTVPEGWKVEILKEGGSFDFLSMINHHNSQMSKSILANFFDKDQGSGSNDGPLVNFADPGDDMFVLMLRGVMNDIANQINHYIIPQLIDMNFKSKKYPKFSWGTLTDAQRAAISKTFEKLGQMAPNVTPEFIRELEKRMAKELGLEVDYEEIEEREAEEAEMERLMAEQQAQMQAQQGPVGPDGVPLAPQQPVDGSVAPAALPEESTQAPLTAEDLEAKLPEDWTLEDFEKAILESDGELSDMDQEALDELEMADETETDK